MEEFNLDDFTLRLIGETLFYDGEYEALGNLSLIDQDSSRERFIASYAPEDGVFVIEEATEWEDYSPGQPDDIGYALAVDSREISSYNSAEEGAIAIMTLAREHNLFPSITLLFEEDEAP